MMSNLTTKRGDSGSALMLGEKCVIIEAPNLTTKSDQKSSQTWKMTKNDQNHQNIKSDKIKKTEKVIKTEKPENQKSSKCRKWKSEKHQKWSKIDPPLKKAKMSLKWPKSTLCEIRAAWSGVFSIPGGTTGPGFKAGFRPPLFLHFFDQFWWILHFMICVFYHFLRFDICLKLSKCEKVTFLTSCDAITIRPYGNSGHWSDQNFGS